VTQLLGQPCKFQVEATVKEDEDPPKLLAPAVLRFMFAPALVLGALVTLLLVRLAQVRKRSAEMTSEGCRHRPVLMRPRPTLQRWRAGYAGAGKLLLIDVDRILFTQPFISNTFKDGRPLADLVRALRTGETRPEQVPRIRVVRPRPAAPVQCL
jgi:hypothetical protein